jgi:hypothetical protein
MAYMTLDVIVFTVLGPAILGVVVWWLARRWPIVGGLLGAVVAAGTCLYGAISFMSGDHRSPYQLPPPLEMFIPLTLVLYLALSYFLGLLKRNAS